MKHKSKFISLFTSLCMIVVMIPSVIFAEGHLSKDIQPTDIVIMHTNDVHSRVQGSEYDNYLGYATVKKVKDQVEEVAPVLLLDSGDALHGLPIANLSNGENIVKIMNEVGYDAMAPGNHDFNYGADSLVNLKSKMKFDLLSSNITKNGTNPFTTSKVYTKGSKKIGVIGLTTPETVTKADPRKVEGYSFDADSLAEILQNEIDNLKTHKVDYIVGLGHLGIDQESAPYRSTDVISKVDGLDIFIDGHSHSVVENVKVKDKSGNDVILAQAGYYLSNIGQVIIHEDGSIDTNLISERNEDENIKSLISEMNEEIQPLLDKVVGKTNVLLDGNRDPGVRMKETNLGDLVTDALKASSKADVALINGGGIRTSVDVGDITYGEFNAVLPFGNVVTKIEVSGKRIFEALEFGTKDCPKAAGGFPQVSGIIYEIHTFVEYKDSGSEYGVDSRVRNIKINGERIDFNKTYSLATNDFIAAGGDGYEMFKTSKKLGEYRAMDEALINYIEEQPNGTVGDEYANPGGRIVIYNSIEEVMSGEEDLDDTEEPGDESIVIYAGLLIIAVGAGVFTIKRKKQCNK